MRKKDNTGSIEDLEDFIKKYDEEHETSSTPKLKRTETVQKEITLTDETSNMSASEKQFLELQIKNSNLQTQIDMLKTQTNQLRYSILFTGIFAIIAMILSIVL